MATLPTRLSTESLKFKALIYGTAGIGKTKFAVEAFGHKDLRDVLVLNREGGLLTVADSSDEFMKVDLGVDDEGNPNNRTVQDLEDVFWSIMRKSPGFETVKTVVIDSASEIQVADLQELVAINKKTEKPGRDIDEIFQADYGKDTARLRRVFRMFRDAPFNVVFTALVTEVQPKAARLTENRNKDFEPVEVRPALTQKLSESLMGYVDFCWYMYLDDDGNRAFLTQPSGPYKAKTRNPRFAEAIGKKVTNPSLPDLYDLLVKSTVPQKKTAAKAPNKEVK